MKREFLKNFKVGEQELPKEIIDAIMDENGRDIESAKKPFADYDDLKARLDEANKTIESFKDLDIDAIRKEANEWKAKAEQAEKDAAAKVGEVKFNARLTAAITGAKGKSTRAILGELGEERLAELRSSKNQDADIKAALEGLKKESGYLFESAETPPPYAAGTGTHKMVGDDTSKMTYTELCAYMAAHPDTKI